MVEPVIFLEDPTLFSAGDLGMMQGSIVIGHFCSGSCEIRHFTSTHMLNNRLKETCTALPGELSWPLSVAQVMRCL